MGRATKDESDAEEEGNKETEIEPTETADDKKDEDGNAAGGTKRKRKRKRKKKTSSDGAIEDNDTASNDQEDAAQQRNSVECTVYVEGIPFDASPDLVKEFFKDHGDIEDIVELRLPTWQDSGRLRGYGHVLFKSQKSYEEALKLSGKHMGKRYLTIQPANTPKGGLRPTRPSARDEPPPKDCKTLFVHNLPYNATEDEIAEAFEGLGNNITIVDHGVRIARNSVTRQSKGFGYVDFASPKDVRTVMQSKKLISVGGRTLRLDYDTGRMKGSYRSESGRLWTKENQERKRSRVN